MLTILWMLSLFLPASCAQILVTCAYKSLCQQALLSGNDVVLQCDHLQAYWYFSSFQGEAPFLVSSLPNIKKLPGGSLQLNKPQPSQTGLYRCEDNNTALVVEYEIDFQDVTMLHITHKGLGQNPLQNQSLSLGRKEIIFTHWEPWQDCNRCGVPGERKRLGYCYIQESLENPVPCWLYLGDEKLWSSRLQPEMQVEACLVPCNHSKEIIQPFFTFDISKLGQSTSNMQLTCPLASIYR
ncbi:protein FAM187B [Bos mutus]|uniref:Protein FAM187B n=2 Tax=Bos mutus TaxID=72004 RepID=L8IIG1_9CETA|nr:PREDICTED: protein FAM187B [Bos mutus]ELR56116.1 Protein FAM187B [Bos mutus]